MRMDINVYPTEELGLRLLTEQPSDPALKQRWKGPYLEGAVPLDPKSLSVSSSESGGQPFTLISLGAMASRGQWYGSGYRPRYAGRVVGIPEPDIPIKDPHRVVAGNLHVPAGFTLLEMLFVMLIVGLLTSLMAPRLGGNLEHFEALSQRQELEDQFLAIAKKGAVCRERESNCRKIFH